MSEPETIPQRGELRELLDERRREVRDGLQARLARIRDTVEAVSPDAMDPTDASDLDVVFVDIATATLRRIDEALQRLDQGSYGLCTRCGAPIATERLRAMPFAVRCQQCEASRERDEAELRDLLRKHPSRSDHDPRLRSF
jgi:DnaK suppressor protein